LGEANQVLAGSTEAAGGGGYTMEGLTDAQAPCRGQTEEALAQQAEAARREDLRRGVWGIVVIFVLTVVLRVVIMEVTGENVKSGRLDGIDVPADGNGGCLSPESLVVMLEPVNDTVFVTGRHSAREGTGMCCERDSSQMTLALPVGQVHQLIEALQEVIADESHPSALVAPVESATEGARCEAIVSP
jgi:hypothetical protein